MKLFAAAVVLCMSIGSASAENSISWPPSWVQYGNLPATTTDFITHDAGNSVRQAIALQADYIEPPGSQDRVISTPSTTIRYVIPFNAKPLTSDLATVKVAK